MTRKWASLVNTYGKWEIAMLVLGKPIISMAIFQWLCNKLPQSVECGFPAIKAKAFMGEFQMSGFLVYNQFNHENVVPENVDLSNKGMDFT